MVFLNFDNERIYEIVADPNHFLIPWITSNTNDDYNDNNNKIVIIMIIIMMKIIVNIK